VTIDLDKIEHNARTIVDLCRAHGISVVGVTKCTCGYPEVAKAMLRGGVISIGESQLENIQRLKTAAVPAPCMLLRLPSPSEVEEVVAWADVSLNSELSVLARLSEAAQRSCRVHEVIIMVDLGDLREGGRATSSHSCVKHCGLRVFASPAWEPILPALAGLSPAQTICSGW
jgi:predicted amino acid racemase